MRLNSHFSKVYLPIKKALRQQESFEMGKMLLHKGCTSFTLDAVG